MRSSWKLISNGKTYQELGAKLVESLKTPKPIENKQHGNIKDPADTARRTLPTVELKISELELKCGGGTCMGWLNYSVGLHSCKNGSRVFPKDI
ncbi:unnamed protein product [Ceratitis capitata]|uniref:(Mediterranean fruit fly) hypothetical protein n=1 Tax=Ceratitis capitata TaxID=7213 RepID=A0A811V1T4_CERCA|nr:unnamed protein product [Ceratitis capitata]